MSTTKLLAKEIIQEQIFVKIEDIQSLSVSIDCCVALTVEGLKEREVKVRRRLFMIAVVSSAFFLSLLIHLFKRN